MKPRITPLDAFGWHHIIANNQTLQCFRTEKECRQWLADTARIRAVLS